MSKKKDNGKKLKKKKRSIVIIDDTLPISLIRANVLSAMLNNEEIKSLIMYSKKGKEKILEGLKDKSVCFKLHTQYVLKDKNNQDVSPISVNNDTGFALYKISMKSFINTIKADIIEKENFKKLADARLDTNDITVSPEDRIKVYHVVKAKDKHEEWIYPWCITQVVAEVKNKKKKKVCDIRFDL